MHLIFGGCKMRLKVEPYIIYVYGLKPYCWGCYIKTTLEIPRLSVIAQITFSIIMWMNACKTHIKGRQYRKSIQKMYANSYTYVVNMFIEITLGKYYYMLYSITLCCEYSVTLFRSRHGFLALIFFLLTSPIHVYSINTAIHITI